MLKSIEVLLVLLVFTQFTHAQEVIEAFGTRLSYSLPDTNIWKHDTRSKPNTVGSGLELYVREPVEASDGRKYGASLAIYYELVSEQRDPRDYAEYSIHGYAMTTKPRLTQVGEYIQYERVSPYSEDSTLTVHAISLFTIQGNMGVRIYFTAMENVVGEIRPELEHLVSSMAFQQM